jgi:DNA-binding beta-propeller fold protein YncE
MKFTVSSSIRIVRSLSAFCRLHKMNVATSLCGVLALLASPLAYGSPSAARYSGTERTVYSANGANLPSVAVDANGTVYIADQSNNRVLKETPSGLGYTQTTVGPASDALGFTPLAVAVDPFFNVYIVDGANSRVLKETWSGGCLHGDGGSDRIE